MKGIVYLVGAGIPYHPITACWATKCSVKFLNIHEEVLEEVLSHLIITKWVTEWKTTTTLRSVKQSKMKYVLSLNVVDTIFDVPIASDGHGFCFNVNYLGHHKGVFFLWRRLSGWFSPIFPQCNLIVVRQASLSLLRLRIIGQAFIEIHFWIIWRLIWFFRTETYLDSWISTLT